jgi:hypothetical protein
VTVRLHLREIGAKPLRASRAPQLAPHLRRAESPTSSGVWSAGSGAVHDPPTRRNSFLIFLEMNHTSGSRFDGSFLRVQTEANGFLISEGR